jgi:energy-dependent translational throttle protein EttA
VAVGDRAQARRRVGMRLLGEREVRDRVSGQAVGAALEDHEVGRMPLEVGFDDRPGGEKLCIAGARRQGKVELAAGGGARSDLVGGSGAGIQEASVLVRVGDHERRVVLEGVEHAVAVMGVDVDVRDAREPVLALQVFDHDTDVVEDAETRRVRATGMVQARDRHEGPARASIHHRLCRDERSADDVARGLEDALESGRVAAIEKSLAGGRARDDELDVARIVKELELRPGGSARRELQDLPVEALRDELAPECVVPVRAERVAVGKTVAGDALAGDDTGGRSGRFSHALPPRFEGAAPSLARLAASARIADNPRPLTPRNPMAQYIYTMNRVGKVVPPKRHILRDISLSFFPGAKIGVLGLNGSGKSTLLRIMAGTDTDIEGEARPQPGIKVGLLPQEPQLDPEADVRTIVEESAKPVKDALARLEKVYALYSEPDADFDKLAAEQGQLEAFLASVDGHNLERQLDVAADALRLPPWDAKVSQLSGGERRRVALCRLLLSKPDMLLLDEPTNHLDAESVAWLEKYLEQYPSTVICVTHDRYFLDNVAGWILELDRGHGIPWQGNYSSWLEQKERRLAQEEKQQEGLRRTLARELEWVRANPKARQAKSKARLRQFEELSSVEFQARNETNEIYIPPGPRLGDLVIEVQGLRKAYGDRLLIDGLTFRLPQGGIVGIIGPNGAGKTTLFRMLTGAETPDAGTVRTGPSVQIASVDQSRDALDDSKTVWQEISGGQDIIKVGNYETASRGYVGRFNFRGNQQQQHIGELSGGERNRVHLAKLLKSGGNVLLLDEPTNDLDVETLRALEEALLNFPGCAVVISHDRWFLDRIATHILAFEGDSEVVWFEGNYQEYVQDLRRRKGDDADQPHRLRYKPLHA